MNGSVCPKCGSNRILNDECLGCGIIISKFQRAEKNASSPVSFVAPTLPSHPAGASVITDNQYKIALQKNKMYTRIFVCVAALIVAGAAFFGFQHFRKSTSSYGGLYRNDRQIFNLRFPDQGWSHYYSHELDSLPLKSPQDAFYRGKDRDDPEIFLGMWIHLLPQMVQPSITDDQRQELFDAATDEILTKMEAAGFDCTITESEFLGTGAVMDAEILRGQQRLKAKIRTSYWMNRAYTLIIMGEEDTMDSAKNDILRILNSLSFKMSVV
jgi:hypothetical protein